MRILVSACLLGINCKYNGGNNLNKVKSQQSKINRMKKRIETSGIENLEKSDAVKIGKWIKAGLITRTEYKNWIKTYEDSKGTGQISFF